MKCNSAHPGEYECQTITAVQKSYSTAQKNPKNLIHKINKHLLAVYC